MLRYLLFFATFCILSTPASATIRIGDDPGGRIADYLARYRALEKAGEDFKIDGVCKSACTFVTAVVSPRRICVTGNAILGFHLPWRETIFGPVPVTGQRVQEVYEMFPPNVRRWIARNGGLRKEMIYLQGNELATMYRRCK